MSKKLYFLICFVLVVTLASTSHGQVVIGNFEDSNMDGWQIWTGDGNAPGTTTEFNDTTGVTLDGNSLRLEVPEGEYKLALYIQLDDANLVDEFFNNEYFSLDVTRLSSEWEPNTDPNFSGYSALQLIVNANSVSGPVFAQLGGDFSWWESNPLDPNADLPKLATWNYVDAKRQIDPCSVSFLELIIVSYYDPNYTTGGVYYLDNIRLEPRSYQTVIGNFEGDMDGWIVGGDYSTEFNDTIGVTLDGNSLKVETGINEWWMQVLNFELLNSGFADEFFANSVLSFDLTRLRADWTPDPLSSWWHNNFRVAIYGDGDGWSVWYESDYLPDAWWVPDDPNDPNEDLPMTVTMNYAAAKAQMDPNSVYSLGCGIIFSNMNYTSGGIYYLDNIQLRAQLTASNPSPADEAGSVAGDAVLSWTPGDYAFTHDIYFGTDFDDVNNATRANHPGLTDFVENHPNSTYDPPGLLDIGRTYYWRIDEIEGLQIWKGDVWRFRTVNYRNVENFDSYTTDVSLRAVWEDYYTGDDTSAEVSVNTTIRRGVRSMKYWYRNNLPPFYSESRADTAGPNSLPSLIGSDWNIANAKSLRLYFYGQSDNDVDEKMYAALSDGDNPSHTAKVVYYGDMNDIKKEEWRPWDIELQEFVDDNDVNLANVSRIVIGFSHGAGPGGDGTVYFDDIRLFPPRCVPLKRSAYFAKLDYAPPRNLYAGDCVIDYQEIEVMGGDWLIDDYNADPLIAWYKLDDSGTVATDSSVNGNDGNLVGNPMWVAGQIDGALDFDPVDANDYVDIGDDPVFNPSDSFSIALWAYIEDWSEEWGHVMISRRGEENGWQLRRNGSWGSVGDPCSISFTTLGVGRPSDGWGNLPSNTAPPPLNEWLHIAAVYDKANSTKSIYLNGVLDAEQRTNPGTITPSTHNVYIGARANLLDTGAETFFTGKLDDVRLYDKALSQAEIASIMAGGLGSVSHYHPVASVAEVYDAEAEGSRAVNFKDFAVVTNSWLDEEIWP